jgi:hypothetical protein
VRIRTLAAVAIVLLGGACGGSKTGARNVESVVEAFEAEGLPTLIALNRDAEARPAGASTSGGHGDTREALLQSFTHNQPDYVRGLAYSDDPDPEDPSHFSSGGRWMIYVLDSEERVNGFDVGFRSSLPPPDFVRLQRHNVVVLTRKQFRARVERALERTD